MLSQKIEPVHQDDLEASHMVILWFGSSAATAKVVPSPAAEVVAAAPTPPAPAPVVLPPVSQVPPQPVQVRPGQLCSLSVCSSSVLSFAAFHFCRLLSVPVKLPL